jgi:predicted RND superfamily exporter protein
MNEEQILNQRIPYSFSRKIVDNPKTTLLIFFTIITLFATGLSKIKGKFSARIWFDEDHPNIVKLNNFENMFGSDEAVGIGVYRKEGIFNKQTLKVVEEITEELWNVSDVIRVESLTNFNDVSSEEDDINIAPFLDGAESLTPEKLELLKKKALRDVTIPDFYMAKSTDYAMIYGFVKPFHDGTKTYQRVTEQVRKLVAKYKERTDLKFFIVGEVPSNNAFREISDKDDKKITPFMVIFIIFLLIYIFRSSISVLLPLILAGTTISSALGFLGMTGISFNNLLGAIPGILLAISLADALHILFTYKHFRLKGFDNKKSTTYSLAKNFKPTALTTISTAISFFSISLTDIAPVRDLGIVAGVGTILAWLFSYLILGSILSLLSSYLDKKKVVSPKIISFEKVNDEKGSHSPFVDLIDKHKKMIIGVFSFFILLSGYIALQNEVNSDPIKYFDKNLDFRKSYDFTSSKMGGLKGIELVIDSGVQEGIKDPKFLKTLDAYMAHILKHEEIMRVKSFIDIVKKLNQALHGGDKAYYRIPDTNKAIAEILFLYTMGLPEGMDLNNQISIDNKVIRLRLVWSTETSKESEVMVNWLLNEAKKFNLNVDTGGTVPIYNSINEKVVGTFFSSMGMALCFVSLLLLVLFKDLKLALLSMLPNVIPLIFSACAMKLMGHYIDIGTSIVYAVCLGIAVDDTIHFIVNYKTYRNYGHTPNESIAMTFQITGRALVCTTLLLVVGFGIFVFSDFIPNRNFGVLCALTLFLALVTDLIFLPALLMVIDKDKKTTLQQQER